MKKVHRKLRCAFTLLESLVAMFVIALCVLCFVPAFVGTRGMVDKNQRIESATRLAETELESRREAGYALLPAIPSGASSVTALLSQPNSLPGGTGSLKVTYVDASLNPSKTDTGRKRLDVTVGWNQGAQNNGTVTMTTIMGQGGL